MRLDFASSDSEIHIHIPSGVIRDGMDGLVSHHPPPPPAQSPPYPQQEGHINCLSGHSPALCVHYHHDASLLATTLWNVIDGHDEGGHEWIRHGAKDETRCLETSSFSMELASQSMSNTSPWDGMPMERLVQSCLPDYSHQRQSKAWIAHLILAVSLPMG